jgi:hypothetical protein
MNRTARFLPFTVRGALHGGGGNICAGRAIALLIFVVNVPIDLQGQPD